MNSEREFILGLFQKRGMRPGMLYPTPLFLKDVDFDGDLGVRPSIR